jgi:porphobilinogen synthase
MQYPEYRPRRLRRLDAFRRMVRETTLDPGDFIYPLFVVPGKGVRKEIATMPGICNLSVDAAVEEAGRAIDAGVPAVILFGIPERKDAVGSDAWSDAGVVQRAIRALKGAHPKLAVIADACFCEYTDHGHCGVLTSENRQSVPDVDNDATLENLGRLALSYARAGVDMIAPSGMMDGFVGFVRETLDEDGFEELPILAYSAKYASAFYGPFRDAVKSAPQTGDRRGYQMDPANADEAMREVTLDVGEGADLVMVKPALAYLDVIRRVREEFELPVAAYNVSGEYAMLRAAAGQGMLDYERAMLEVLTSIKRAGADVILTYHAIEAAKLLSRG